VTTDDEERELRIELMTTQVERLRQEIKMENRKFLFQALGSLAAAMAAGAAIFGLILHLTGKL
jgi:hypothetical protein